MLAPPFCVTAIEADEQVLGMLAVTTFLSLHGRASVAALATHRRGHEFNSEVINTFTYGL